MDNRFLDAVKGGLIVSCQALPGEPLYSSFIMARMAVAAKEAGAVGIRANSVVDIQSIRDYVDLPIIGIIKKDYPESEVYITPTMKEIRQVCAAGAEVVAIDATARIRPDGKRLSEVVAEVKKEFPDVLLMADSSTIDDVKNAIEVGFDIIGTTLHGYTKETEMMNISDNDFEFLKDVLAISPLPVIAEGKIGTPEKAAKALALGCHAVVVGGAITRPKQIAESFIEAIKGAL
ncbi:aldolase-type tim barrel [Trichococcus palustris]|uniref:Putative N-acetylmannosamine-6-phosphate 2-epimerase n=1 Tax=Trichococcus palustris TaxID=140314 RepID=A0A143YYN5_9LACT|nr:N-acetylmannosamine-6-phosphate 2-epimerase [Trichococcus palustris]CZR01953.1 aldolase-type tim barrel [Trichococcus palustris]SFL16451.1 N-acylglucosamine-6-phosphate 2-epimerase [Trichococcus palustris]